METPNANKVAKSIKDIIDAYWAGTITKEEAQRKIASKMDSPNIRLKIMRGSEYTGVFCNILGKRRVETFEMLTGQHKDKEH